ncbi:MAG: LicD family protein [Treponema sp.]|nr:LicD family protein [Treponema sp.]
MVDLKIQLPDHFLDEEVRCDYLVTHEMKEVWAVELDLLAELLRVCKKHNIKIFASGGTMLGAVRHKGFIPWDDDIDMAMFRDDYNKLCEVASKEFMYPYFFQTEYTDKGSLRGHAQLRNSETTGILSSEFKNKLTFNQGIFLDIFPLDSVIDNEKQFQKQRKKALFFRRISSLCSTVSTRYHENGNRIKVLIKRILHFLFRGLFEFLEIFFYTRFEKLCKKYNSIKTEKVSPLGLNFRLKSNLRYRTDFDNVCEMNFEFMSIPVGTGFDHSLTEMYGNYKTFVKGTSLHEEIILDTNKSYKETIKEASL